MNRRNRTLVVLLVAVMVASGASYFVYRAVISIPVREIEVKSYQVAVASKALPVGTMVRESDVKLVAWPASSPVAGGYTQSRRGGEPRPDCAGRRERAADLDEAGADRSRRGFAADDRRPACGPSR